MKKINIRIIVLFVLLLCCGKLFADGGESISDLFSPTFLSGGASVVSTESPQADALNPAASGNQQRITIDLSYLGIAGEPGWGGHIVNLGNTIPTKIGVFTWSAHFMTSPEAYTEIYLGTQGGIKGSFAKAVYPDLLIGTGINLTLGSNWALTTDIGFIKFMGDLSWLKDFKWGVVLKEFGYAGLTEEDYPAPFSVAAGAGFSLIKTENFFLDINTDLYLPTFQNIRFTLGSSFSYRDIIGLKLATRADLVEMLDNDFSGLIPSFGIYYNFKTDIKKEKDILKLAEHGWGKSQIKINASAAPMADDLWAFGTGVNIPLGVIDKRPPMIEIDISGLLSGGEKEETKTDSEGINNETEEINDDNPDADKTSEENIKKSGSYKVTYKPQVLKNSYRKRIDTEKETDKNENIKIDYDNLEYKIVAYISPNNDGILDEIEFPINIKDTRYIKGFSFIILDDKGSEVRKIINKEKRPENDGLKGFFERLFSVKKGIEIPEKLRWDGISNSGSVVPDGVYSFYVEAMDDNGNVGKTDQFGIVVDTVPPLVEMRNIDKLDLIFSPNEDGNKDTITINQTGSKEDIWQIEIINTEGIKYFEKKLKDCEPADFEWDGKNDQGLLVADGIYNYEISSKDRAGNKTVKKVNNIIVNTEVTPISVTIDTSYFAPGIKGSINKITFIPDISIKTGIDNWELIIKNSNGIDIRKISGKAEVPEKIYFNGMNENKVKYPEGKYTGQLKVKYKNGNYPDAVSPVFNIDFTPPQAMVKQEYKVFSPNGDGKKDSIGFFQETSLEDEWKGIIYNSEKEEVKTNTWIQTADSKYEWDGRGNNGRLLDDGRYSYKLLSIDKAGSRGESNEIYFTLDTAETPVILSVEYHAFSPNADGFKDTINILPEMKIKEGIDKYSLKILSETGDVIRTYSGKGKVKESVKWDGLTDSGKRLPDGNYKAILEVLYQNGNSPVASSRLFLLDTEYPEIEVKPDIILFSPDKDGKKDSVRFLQNSSSEALWHGEIHDIEENVIKKVFWKGKTSDYIWDGKDESGNTVSDGTYSYVVSSVDSAGNPGKAIVPSIKIDTVPTKIYVTVTGNGLSPNGDGLFEDITFNTLINNKEGIDFWKIEIIDKKGNINKEFTGTTPPKKIIWDGKNEHGLIIDGEYSAIFKTVYKKGNEPISETPLFILDTTAPFITVGIKPAPFSPDNDGIEDELYISLKVKDASKTDNWDFEIFDRKGNYFNGFNGLNLPKETIVWDGRSKYGELVMSAEDYTYKMAVKDVFGNTGFAEGVIPVDILVIKEGDRLKIQISNINFAPDLPQLITDDPEIVKRNNYVLKRLSEILNKYSSYDIRIEGHAVSVFWADPVKKEKEEKEELLPLSYARAETVKDKLVELGIQEKRISIKGIGGKEPLVPHSDLINRWKNRRVEFILIK